MSPCKGMTVQCLYCGQDYWNEDLTAHILACPKHPAGPIMRYGEDRWGGGSPARANGCGKCHDPDGCLTCRGLEGDRGLGWGWVVALAVTLCGIMGFWLHQ